MQIKSVNSSDPVSFKGPIITLCIYFGAIVPITKIFFHTIPWVYKYGDIIFFSAVILLILRKSSFNELGFSTKYLNQHLVLGLIASGILLFSLPLLAKGFEILEITDHALLKEQTKVNNLLNICFFLESF